MVQNVVNAALEFGVSYVLFWETIDNECTGGAGCSSFTSVAPSSSGARVGVNAGPGVGADAGSTDDHLHPAALGHAMMGAGRCYGK